MPSYIYVWVSFGILSPLLLSIGAVVCSEKETLLQPMPSSVTQPTDCLMECTGMTYIKKLQLQDNDNIRLKDSTEGDSGEYCWSTELKCTIGENFHTAYVVLPVDITAVGHEQLEVKTTDPSATKLHIHTYPITIANSCGLRYEVTQHFSTQTTGTLFCIQVVAQRDAVGDTFLKCPPYLVTFWQRNQSNQQDVG